MAKITVFENYNEDTGYSYSLGFVGHRIMNNGLYWSRWKLLVALGISFFQLKVIRTKKKAK